jgi:hypothetical protein
MTRTLTALALGALLGACGSDAGGATEPAVTTAGAPASARLGQPAPDFELTFLNHEGGDSLSDLKGRMVLIEFWRTW